MKKRPRVEDLLLPKLLYAFEILDKRSLPTSEAETSLVLSPVTRALLDPKAGPQLFFGAIARTAVLFLIDHEEFAQAVASADTNAPFVGLPPLPYPRIAVECMEDATWQMIDKDGNHDFDLDLFFINETERGWFVAFLMRLVDSPIDDPVQSILFFEVEHDGSVTTYLPSQPAPDLSHVWTKDQLRAVAENYDDVMRMETRGPDTPEAAALRSTPVEFAHLVNARGVTVNELDVPRPQRRQFTRKGFAHPQVYFVYIGDGTSDSHPGHGDREYHVRWLVRGHWRHYRSGRQVWVRPYIKGPAGAPWKGRPIYVAAAFDE